ncbi:hypothetical protein [Alkalinema sp. FACHB-956]|uniref:hypothetical protein n=1 Tax=Alkalinema sp. FACHB-956 TaxID=2692768 RepID=UPI0016824046|nr:hypothetical protein [Alkalinema sp. FACHB-956]MBD2329140.1 hypothetical protein [Alkalinema sp. FACHB-956]
MASHQCIEVPLNIEPELNAALNTALNTELDTELDTVVFGENGILPAPNNERIPQVRAVHCPIADDYRTIGIWNNPTGSRRLSDPF